MLFEKIKKILTTPRILFTIPVLKILGGILPDSVYISLQYFQHFGRFPNLKTPKTFNEKLQWLKLHDRKSEYTVMVDKVEAKKWVAERIGDQYLIPTLGVWNRAEDIDFETLPNEFVLKTNHDSGKVIICKNKSLLNIEAARKILDKSLSVDYYKCGREWPYKNVSRKILAEELLPNSGSDTEGEIPDYKFMCFNGKVKYIFVCSERGSDEGLKVTFFDREWNKMPFERHYPSSKKEIPCPETYNKMIELAEKLSSGTKFLRVDFYETGNRIYFGELTFYPGCGYEEFTPEEWDAKLGDLIILD